MIVYRLSKEKYKDDISGEGARLYGGRWNKKGVAVLYTSESRSLANCEALVHLGDTVPIDYFLIEIDVPDHLLIHQIQILNLPPRWKEDEKITSKLGDDFVKSGQFLGLCVPSVVVEGDFNYVLNPNHADFGEVKIIRSQPFTFDKRFFGNKP